MKHTSLLAASLLSMALGCGSSGPANVDQFILPGSTYFPESMNIAADGTIFVGSLANGEVVKFAPGQTAAQVFVPAGSVTGVAGVLVDDTGGALYICTNNLSMTNPTPPVVRSYKLTDGTALGSYPFPANGLCNDMAFDGSRNLYMTESIGGIVYKLAPGGTALTLWTMDPLLKPAASAGFAAGADGITFDGQSNLYVNNNSTGALVKFPINADGSAGTSQAITVTLTAPDGMRQLDANTLLLTENTGSLIKVALSGTVGTVTTIKSGLKGPTSVVRYGQYDYVSEGQLSIFLTMMGTATLPFDVVRIAD